MKLPILNLDNFSIKEQRLKIFEEVGEFNFAIPGEHELEEAIDLIQATFGYLQKIASIYEIGEAFKKHNEKLESRNWQTEGYINFTFHYK